MTERTYKCNFCHKRIEPVIGDQMPRNAGFGIEWSTQPIPANAPEWMSEMLVQKQLHQVENHICVVCLTAIRNIEWQGGIDPTK